MKKFFTLIIVGSFMTVQAQYMDIMDFENPVYNYTLTIPSGSQWQVAAPTKSILNTAQSSPNVIITNSVSPYPVNDTSVFIISHPAGWGFTAPHTASIDAWYNAYSDTTDRGKIEFSADNGATWINLMSAGTYSNSVWWSGPVPKFYGSTGWQHFMVDFAQLGPQLNIQFGQIILYRFSFISHGIQTNKDGLMFDSFTFSDYTEGIEEFKRTQIPTHLAPVPAQNIIRVDYDDPDGGEHVVKLLNNLGEIVSQKKLEKSAQGTDLDISFLPPGIYSLSLSNTDGRTSLTRFIKL